MKPDRLFSREDWTGDRALECDVVVVGSGAGGAVMAAELAEGGLDVIVLEEGGYHPTSEFTAETTKMIRKLYRDGGATFAIGSPPVAYQEGRAVGGSTVINGGMSWRTPEKILDRWWREEAVERIRPVEMGRYFERVERRISSSYQDPWTIGRDSQLMKEGADKLGWEVIPNIRNQFHCAGTNNCAFGCPTGAKRSTLVTYVPRALSFGARLYADCKVERVMIHDQRAVGVEGRVLAPNGEGAQRFTVRAKAVVSSAGAMHTPALLFRSGVKAKRLGHNLSLHPNVKVIAVFDENVEGWKGVHQAYQVREFQDEGYLFAAVNLPPSIVSMGSPLYGAALGELLRDYHRIVVAGMLLEDSVTGRVRLGPGGLPMAFYKLSDFDAHRLVRGTALLSELLFSVGARRIILPFEGVDDLRSPDDIQKLFAHPIHKGGMEVVTVHLMGTAAMGEHPERHVCDSFGKVRGLAGLYVSDASLFPSPIGVNPMETIMALSTRNAERLLDSGAAR